MHHATVMNMYMCVERLPPLETNLTAFTLNTRGLSNKTFTRPFESTSTTMLAEPRNYKNQHTRFDTVLLTSVLSSTSTKTYTIDYALLSVCRQDISL